MAEVSHFLFSFHWAMGRRNCKTRFWPEVSGLLAVHCISSVWSIACLVLFGANSHETLGTEPPMQIQ
jgi:hypothetical protein